MLGFLTKLVVCLVVVNVGIFVEGRRFGGHGHWYGNDFGSGGRRPSGPPVWGGRPGGGSGWGSGWGSSGSSSTTAASSTTSAPVSTSTAPTSTIPPVAPTLVPLETRTMDQLYAAALAEGGHLVVYAGGDAPDQQDYTKMMFEERFPGITVDIIVDLSKFHGPRIDYQLATNSVVVDVAHLQTLQDYPRWKEEGVLLNYKPIDWDKVYPSIRDEDGAYTGFTIYMFSPLVNHNLLPNNSTWPREAQDFLRPELKNKIVLSYPNDDDAILFWFQQIVDKYGWNYVEQLKEQNLTLVRSTQYPADYVKWRRSSVAMLTNGPWSPDDETTLIIPTNDPFISWPQTAAIFKAAKNPETAKLYISWLLEARQQQGSWSARSDIPPPTGYKKVWEYPNTDPTAFARYMEDREAIEQFKTQISLIFGEVKGASPTGELGTHPVKPIAPIPH